MNGEPTEESVEQLRGRLNADPLDLALRFQYGVALFRSGDIHSALPELQKARQHPDHRAPAMRFLAEIFDQLGMGDIATYMRRGADGDDPPDPDSGTAPKPAPLHPISPLIASEASELPKDSERDSD